MLKQTLTAASPIGKILHKAGKNVTMIQAWLRILLLMMLLSSASLRPGWAATSTDSTEAAPDSLGGAGLRAQDSLWLIGTRHLGSPHPNRCYHQHFQIMRYEASGWQDRDISEFIADQRDTTAVYVHGNRIDRSRVFSRGHEAYRAVVRHGDPADWRWSAVSGVSGDAGKHGGPAGDVSAVSGRGSPCGMGVAAGSADDGGARFIDAKPARPPRAGTESRPAPGLFRPVPADGMVKDGRGAKTARRTGSTAGAAGTTPPRTADPRIGTGTPLTTATTTSVSAPPSNARHGRWMVFTNAVPAQGAHSPASRPQGRIGSGYGPVGSRRREPVRPLKGAGPAVRDRCRLGHRPSAPLGQGGHTSSKVFFPDCVPGGRLCRSC